MLQRVIVCAGVRVPKQDEKSAVDVARRIEQEGVLDKDVWLENLIEVGDEEDKTNVIGRG